MGDRELKYKQNRQLNISKRNRNMRIGKRIQRFNANRDLSEYVEESPVEEIDQRRVELKKWLKMKANSKTPHPKPFLVAAHPEKKNLETKKTFNPPIRSFPKPVPSHTLATHSELSSVRLTKAAELRMKALANKINKSLKGNTNKTFAKRKSVHATKVVEGDVTHNTQPTKDEVNGDNPIELNNDDLIKCEGNENNEGNIDELNVSLNHLSVSSLKRRSIRLMKKDMESDIETTPFLVFPHPDPLGDDSDIANVSRTFVRDIVNSGLLGSVNVYSSTPRSILKTKKNTHRSTKSVIFNDSV